MHRLTPFVPALLVAVSTFFASLAQSAVLTVRQDGTGQYTTINAARAAAVNGDVIEVGPGTYLEGEIDFSISVTLVSTDGAAATVIDGEDVRRLLIFRTQPGSVVDGFTLKRGFQVSAAGALRVQQGANVIARNCIFDDNYSGNDGGAITCRDPASNLQVLDCTFVNNRAARHAAAAVVVLDGTVNFDRCQFINNQAPTSGVLATNSDGDIHVSNSLFTGNQGGASVFYNGVSESSIHGSTFYGNQGGVTVLNDIGFMSVQRNIFANEASGTAIVNFGTLSHSCNVFWDNPGGSIDGEALAADEVEADPLFCDAANGDYTISIHSPAAPANSACAQLIGAFPTNCSIEPPPPPPTPVIEPVILSITDVPNDQGRQVRIRWERADYDAPDQPYVITGYAVYRYQGDFVRMIRPDASVGRGKDVAIDGWDYITTVPARGDEIYQVVAPTLCDTPKHGDPCYSVFFVSAMTPNPLEFFDSAPDTGESIDNLPPGPPGSLAVAAAETGMTVSWEAPGDEDVVRYFVYRSFGGSTLGDPVHVTSGLEWTDPEGSTWARYWVAAVDDADNVGEPISSDPTTNVGIVPGTSFLGQNSPNPFNPSTTIQFGLAANRAGRVTLEVFDVTGRRVKSLLNENRAAGTWRVTWDGTTDAGTRVSSGVYFYRLQAPQFQQTRRMTLVE